jgi:hypothetical protein
MVEQPSHILKHMDDDAIRWQYCAICGQQRQRVIRQDGRPDYALCLACRSAFILEDGSKMRMLYGFIPEVLVQTRAFALKQWRQYFEIRSQAEQERSGSESSILPTELKSQTPVQGLYATNQDAILDLEAEKSALFYDHVKKLAPPPRALRETGELPNLDDLFKD